MIFTDDKLRGLKAIFCEGHDCKDDVDLVVNLNCQEFRALLSRLEAAEEIVSFEIRNLIPDMTDIELTNLIEAWRTAAGKASL